jgi:hypothetical protein
VLSSYTTAADTNWQPIIAIRKTANFNGRTNSVNIELNSYEVAATGNMELRVTVGGTTSNLTWATPTGRTLAETAVESKITTIGTALAASSDGEPTQYSYVIANGTGSNTRGIAQSSAEFVLGQTTEVILWIRRTSGSGVIVINHAHITWTGDW